MSWTVESNSYSNSSWGDGPRKLTLTISERVNQNKNSSYLDWTITSSGHADHYVTTHATTLKINGSTVYSKAYTPYTDHAFPAATGHVSGTIEVPHNANGKKRNVPIVFSTRVGTSDQGPNDWAGDSDHVSSNVHIQSNLGYINLTDISVYTLTLSSDANTTINVDRTSSGYTNASLGVLADGATLYSGDTLRIDFIANDGFLVDTHSVNGASFVPGSTHTVSGDVLVVSTGSHTTSSVGATNAEIGSVSTITITKYNPSYVHSLRYTFGNLSGYIRSNGTLSLFEQRFSATTVPFVVPSSFYNVIPNALSGECTITCRTYANMIGNEIGDGTTTTFTVYVNQNNSTPTIVAIPPSHPSDSAPRLLTNDDNILIRYQSDVTASATISARNGASIVSCSINGTPATITSGVASAYFEDSSAMAYLATVTDSRGLTTTANITSTAQIVPYIPLTCNPVIRRDAPSNNIVYMSVSGNIYRGAFDVGTNNNINSLSIRYQYRAKGSSTWSNWVNVVYNVNASNSDITFGANSYHSTSDIALTGPAGGFDYQQAWEFRVQARDGCEMADGSSSGRPTLVILSTVTCDTITVQKGYPIFDWGENDFNINGELRLNNTNIFDLIYPVGTIYRSANSQLPSSIDSIGTWTTVATGSADEYAWQRTS